MKKRRVLLAGGLVLALLIAGATVYLTVKKPKATGAVVTQTITYSTDTPDENPPGKDFVWKGGANDPKYIELPTIKAGGYLQNVGVDQKKAVAVPNNIHMAGWFIDTVRPGEKGNSIIDGHVNGRKNDGIFKNLIKLKKGDTVSVEFGDGRKKSFEVDEVVSVKTAEAASVLFSQKPGITNQLTLITCGGVFNRQINQYEERVIAIAQAM